MKYFWCKRFKEIQVKEYKVITKIILIAFKAHNF